MRAYAPLPIGSGQRTGLAAANSSLAGPGRGPYRLVHNVGNHVPGGTTIVSTNPITVNQIYNNTDCNPTPGFAELVSPPP